MPKLDSVECWGPNNMNNGGMRLQWSGNGFGEFDIVIEKDGSITVDTETMGRDFGRELLKQLIDKATMGCD